MKPYRPKLQAVLTVRQHAEQAALEAFAQALLNRQRAALELDGAERRLSACWNDLRTLLAGGSAAGRISAARGFIAGLEEKVKAAQSRLGECERTLQQCQRKFSRARQEREAIERFQSRHRARYQRELQRHDQKWLDDLAGRRTAPAALALFPAESAGL